MRLSRKAIEIVIMSNQNSCPPTLNDASPEKGREAPATSPTLTTLTRKEREREREKVTRKYVQRGEEYISNCFCSLRCSCLQKGRTNAKLNKYFKLVSHVCMHVPSHAHTLTLIVRLRVRTQTHTHTSSEIGNSLKILV